MWNGEVLRDSRSPWMICNIGALKDTCTLVRQSAPPNAIQVEDGGVRGKARPDRRYGPVLGPIHDLRQTAPVGLIRQLRRARLCPGYNKPVRPAVPQAVQRGIVLVNVGSRGRRPRDAGQ